MKGDNQNGLGGTPNSKRSMGHMPIDLSTWKLVCHGVKRNAL